jgi:hypothetical protein
VFGFLVLGVVGALTAATLVLAFVNFVLVFARY